MSEQQKASHLKKVAQTPVTKLKTAEESPGETAHDNFCLSVDFKSASAELPISSSVFEGIWNKATELLTLEGAIAAAPGLASQARTVISKSRLGFHTVVPGKGGRFTCDNCPNYKSLGICSHTVAVAEANGVLPEFITWFRRSKNVTPNLTKLLTSDMPQGRGRKGGKGPRRRKDTTGEILNRVSLLPQYSADAKTVQNSISSAPPRSLDMTSPPSSSQFSLSSMYGNSGSSAPSRSLDMTPPPSSSQFSLPSMYGNSGSSAPSRSLDMTSPPSSSQFSFPSTYGNSGSSAPSQSLDRISPPSSSQFSFPSTYGVPGYDSQGPSYHAFSPAYLPTHAGQNPLPFHPSTPSILGIGSGHSYGNTYNTLVFPDAAESVPSCSAQQSRLPPPLICATSSSPQSPSDHDHFEVVFLTKRVKKCYGCSREFAKQPDGSNLQPPYDIVIRHADHREYYYEGEKRSTKQKQNTYFHPSLTCVMSKCSSFNPHYLNISGVQNDLLPVHITFLKNNLGMQI